MKGWGAPQPGEERLGGGGTCLGVDLTETKGLAAMVEGKSNPGAVGGGDHTCLLTRTVYETLGRDRLGVLV